jgi:enoyl-[acyl-carrier protein] reductase II
MSFENKITQLFNIQLPIIQAGMVWASGWELASAVSNAGGLGILGAGSMYPDILRAEIQKTKAATNKPFAVNLPMLYPDLQAHINIIIDEKVPIVFTSAGNPKIWTATLKEAGIIVVHVVSSALFAQKAEAAGCDAVVAEGFEAGGHNGREETTTMVLIPLVHKAVKIPVIAAGGIATGAQMLAAFALGAEAVQIGSRFVCSTESCAHIHFKKAILDAGEGDTQLGLKQLAPVRLLKNDFALSILALEREGQGKEELTAFLGRGRAKKGMYEGDMKDGELEIGQVSAMIEKIKPAAEIIDEIWKDFNAGIEHLKALPLSRLF